MVCKIILPETKDAERNKNSIKGCQQNQNMPEKNQLPYTNF